MTFIFVRAGETFRLKEALGRVGREGLERPVQSDAHALLALAHAELAGQLHLVTCVVLAHQALERLHNLAGTLQVAAGTDTNRNLHIQCNSFC